MINSARLRFGRIFPRPHRQSGFIPALILLLWCLLSVCSPAQAESFLRVSKKGVIHYYFSNRPGDAPSVSRISRRAQLLPRSAQARLSPDGLEPLIQEASRQQNLPPSLVKAVIRVESNFNPAATSPKGAQGLMQLMPGTAGDLQVVDG